MPPVVLYPHFDHDAIEERYASWQTEMLLRRDHSEVIRYSEKTTTDMVVKEVGTDHVLVVTDPLLLPSRDLGKRLQTVLAGSGAFAALPSTNETTNPMQRLRTEPYLTVPEFEAVSDELTRSEAASDRTLWDASNPGAFLCATADLAAVHGLLHHATEKREVVISRNDFVHRWRSLRGETRLDLLARVSTEAKNILEIGCGEAPLGEALKKRQKCRVVGIEIDRHAAAIAQKRIDDVYCGDLREIVAILHDKFDWIVGGDVVEHLDEPWSFLSELRRITAPGGHVLLSIPNIGNASIVSGLMNGRFDYAYMGLTCVGHVRFFTRDSIDQMLTIAGWQVVEITTQESPRTIAQTNLLDGLRRSGLQHAPEELLPVGFYVVARNAG